MLLSTLLDVIVKSPTEFHCAEYKVQIAFPAVALLGEESDQVTLLRDLPPSFPQSVTQAPVSKHWRNIYEAYQIIGLHEWCILSLDPVLLLVQFHQKNLR